ncbi:MAG: cytochrome C family [Geobacteraceae bacterium]|nr:MAG: cytochrome C family [Geobacteraceae bacterium]
MHRKVSIIYIVLILTLSAVAAHAGITFVYPAQKSWVKRSDYLILKLNNTEINGVKISVNGLASDMLMVGSTEYRKAFKDFVIVQPVWDPGKNEVVVEGFNKEKKIETASTDIFYNQKNDPALTPKEYRANVMHTPEGEELCAPCHNMSPTEAQLNSSPEKGNPCYTCHKRMMSVKFVHGPAGTFSCAYCHSAAGRPKYSAAKRDAVLCNECHAEKDAEFKKRKYLHGPIDAGLCEVCHDPHGSGNPAQLRLPVNELCLSCHEKVGIGTEIHAVRTPSGGGHPLSGPKDLSPLRQGKEFCCVSCHNPHSGDARYYFQSNDADKMKLCQLCHKY